MTYKLNLLSYASSATTSKSKLLFIRAEQNLVPKFRICLTFGGNSGVIFSGCNSVKVADNYFLRSFFDPIFIFGLALGNVE